MGCPGKWKHGLKPVVRCWLNFDPYPYTYYSAQKCRSASPSLQETFSNFGQKLITFSCRKPRQMNVMESETLAYFYEVLKGGLWGGWWMGVDRGAPETFSPYTPLP